MSPTTIKAAFTLLDLIKYGVKLYDAYRRTLPLKRYQKEISRLNKELAAKDSKLTTAELIRILNI